MNRELTKAMAPMIAMAPKQLALNTRAVKALESLAADFQWQRRRIQKEDAKWCRTVLRVPKKKGGAL
jgi:hypothetical protein